MEMPRALPPVGGSDGGRNICRHRLKLCREERGADRYADAGAPGAQMREAARTAHRGLAGLQRSVAAMSS